jgi:hypothetical protein
LYTYVLYKTTVGLSPNPSNAERPGLIIRDDNDASEQLKSLLQTHPNVDVAAMGFPSDWENELLWK